jgi:two-component system chemotaxis response regulator CheB
LLAERLDAKCALPVSEAVHNERVEPGRVYIAPGDFHMEIRHGRIVLHQQAHRNGCRPAVDLLFASAAQHYKGACLSVIMTGMGRDGLEGTRQLVAAGGISLVQNRESCVVWGMPKFISENGLAHESGNPAQLGRRIAQVVARGGLG